ncbi:MAG: hemolysin III family protein [Lachnospiraceae bacterium]|nr:hemolysin III family protein [Lachnospiraceae bacterium]
MTITIREPGSAITHFIGMMLAICASAPLLIKAALNFGEAGIFAMAVFMTSMVLLYGASTLYHSVNLSGRSLKIFRKIDHMMIFVLIAGSYTPVCLLVLEPQAGQTLLVAVWAIAAVGMVVKALWITCPKWFSSILYIAMGWACLSVFGQLMTRLSAPAFFWLLAGGILYTVGGVIYALKLPVFNQLHKNFGSHEIFHLFVMGGSICHFICMYQYVL